jgi:hypothetical protein
LERQDKKIFWASENFEESWRDDIFMILTPECDSLRKSLVMEASENSVASRKLISNQ